MTTPTRSERVADESMRFSRPNGERPSVPRPAYLTPTLRQLPCETEEEFEERKRAIRMEMRWTDLGLTHRFSSTSISSHNHDSTEDEDRLPSSSAAQGDETRGDSPSSSSKYASDAVDDTTQNRPSSSFEESLQAAMNAPSSSTKGSDNAVDSTSQYTSSADRRDDEKVEFQPSCSTKDNDEAAAVVSHKPPSSSIEEAEEVENTLSSSVIEATDTVEVLTRIQASSLDEGIGDEVEREDELPGPSGSTIPHDDKDSTEDSSSGEPVDLKRSSSASGSFATHSDKEAERQSASSSAQEDTEEEDDDVVSLDDPDDASSSEKAVETVEEEAVEEATPPDPAGTSKEAPEDIDTADDDVIFVSIKRGPPQAIRSDGINDKGRRKRRRNEPIPSNGELPKKKRKLTEIEKLALDEGVGKILGSLSENRRSSRQAVFQSSTRKAAKKSSPSKSAHISKKRVCKKERNMDLIKVSSCKLPNGRMKNGKYDPIYLQKLANDWIANPNSSPTVYVDRFDYKSFLRTNNIKLRKY